MINQLHAFFHDPARGWDPITEEYARAYGAMQVADRGLVERFDRALGGLAGKCVVDVASGPGHYAIEFARRGAKVVCLDVSRSYLAMAQRRFTDAGLEATYALGYLDHICSVTDGEFDGVFSNIAWNYCMNDLSYGRQLVAATVVGGKILIRETNELFERDKSVLRSLRYFLNRHTGIKIGHLHPPRGRIAATFERLGCAVEVDYADSLTDIVTATRRR